MRVVIGVFAAALIASCSSSKDAASVDGGVAASGDGGGSRGHVMTAHDARAPQDARTQTRQDGSSGTTNDASAGHPQSDASGGVDTGSQACLGSSLLTELGESRLLVGGMVADATASSAPIDLRYIYLSGGLFDGTAPCASCATGCTAAGVSCASSSGCAWWGCWQYDMDPPGETARDLVSGCKAASPPQIPMFTYYQILQASGASQGAGEVAAANTASLMERYFADWRFLLQQIGQDVAILHIEPDFWGFAQQGNTDAHSIPAAVASANPTDCAGVESSIAGMGQCMISMVRKYAPNARVGLHASGWATNIDVLYNTSASLDVAGEAQKVATFLAACGETMADFVTVETSDRDAGYYTSIGQDKWWDDTNATLPDYTQDLTWITTLTEALGKPALYWQTPLGNANQTNVTDHWQDNRVDYFFGHMADVAAAHVIGIAYGAGAGGQTTPESDGGNFISQVKAYVSSGGQALCP